MKVILSPKYYGYCPGLKRSLKVAAEVINEANKTGQQIFFDVPLAHNTEVTKDLQEKGLKEVNIDEISDAKKDIFLVSAHGVSAEKIALLKKKNFDIRSATCPTVRRLQDIAISDYKAGYQIVIFGKANHAETTGVNGCIGNSAIVIRTLDQAKDLKLANKTSVLCQTTFSLDEFKILVKILSENNPETKIVARQTACPVVENRVQGARKYAKEVKPDLVVVVGSTTSSNTKLLAHEIEKEVRTIMVDTENDLKKGDFKGINTVLVMSGTSAPPEVVEKVAKKLESF